jgi:serine phosphatase RsbU (regulator of sigma subunit)
MNHIQRFTILLLHMVAVTTFAQGSQVDSLKSILGTLNDDTLKANILNDLGEILLHTDPAKAITYGTEAKLVSENLKYQKGVAAAYQTIGLGNLLQGEYIQCAENLNRSLSVFESINDFAGVANILSKLGSLYTVLGDGPQGIRYYLKGLRIANRTGDSTRIGILLIHIGSVYSDQNSLLDSALYYFKHALRIGEFIGDMDLIGSSIIHLGETYYSAGRYDSALYYFENSRSVISANVEFSVSLNYLGRIYAEKDDFQKAIQYHQDALEMAMEENSSVQVLEIYLGLATTWFKQGSIMKAIDYYTQAKSLAQEIGSYPELSEAYGGLAASYAELSDFKNAYLYSSLQNQNARDRQRTESDHTKYLLSLYKSLEKEKEAEIDILEQQSIIEQLKNKRQRIVSITTGSVGILLLMLVAGLLHRMFYIRKTNAKINRQKLEIEAQRDKIEAQRDLLVKQKKDITDSINYAQRIQDALLPSQTYIRNLLSEFFIIYRPRDIVSGDFYWIKEIHNRLVFIGADCTGHGVPGGFMSMLGVTLLNDLIHPDNLDHPDKILDQLRVKVKEMLTQNGKIGEQKDGMDMAIAIMDRTSSQLRFAGANHPLYLIRNKNGTDNGSLAPYLSMQNNNYILYELKGDSQPIGVYWEENGFHSHVVDLRNQDTFYIFSDGFIDQYGGELRKKFKTANFKKLLLSLQTESMESQRQHIEDAFISWKGNYEQIDDVCVIGVKV